MVTHTYTEGGVTQTREFDTIADAFDAARADARGDGTRVPVSIDDHEGNIYDGPDLITSLRPREPGGPSGR